MKMPNFGKPESEWTRDDYVRVVEYAALMGIYFLRLKRETARRGNLPEQQPTDPDSILAEVLGEMDGDCRAMMSTASGGIRPAILTACTSPTIVKPKRPQLA